MSEGTPPPYDPYGQPPQQPYGRQQPYYAPQSHGSATTAFVLGICGLALCGVLGIPAFIVGRRAEREIRASNGALTGEGMAKAGWIMGLVAMILMLGAFLLVLVVLLGGFAATTSQQY